MPRADYRCPDCGRIITAEFPFGQRASRQIRTCDAPHHPTPGPLLVWIPFSRFSCFNDAGTDGPDSFSKFTLPVEDPSSPTGFREETIGSLADIRRLEKSSAQAERNGEGRAMIWRDYNQDRSNRDVHTIAPDPSLAPPKRLSNDLPVGVRRGDPVITTHGEV